MSLLTPNQAVEARQSLNLSQAMVARDTGLNRAYLSQFEGSKRVLEDPWLTTLHEYYVSQGWEPVEDTDRASVEQRLKSEKHGLTIVDGFVISSHASIDEAETLLEEYYDNAHEIEQLKAVEFKRGILGGLSEHEIRDKSVRAFALMARQCQIVQLLHGRHESIDHSVSLYDSDTIRTAGDYIEAITQAAKGGQEIETGEAI